MKLCFVTYSLALGGAEQSLSLMADTWARKGYTVSIVRLEQTKEPPYYPLSSSIRLIDLQAVPASSPAFSQLSVLIRLILSLRHTIRQEQPEVVISFLDWVNVVSIISALGLRIPLVYSERVDPRFAPTREIWKFLRPLVYPFGDRLVVLSSGCLEPFSGRVRRSAAVIPNPILAPALNLSESGTSTREKTVIGMGRLVPQKGFDLLIEAFSEASSELPDWKLIIYGEGPERPTLEARIRSLGLRSRVLLPGITGQPFERLQEASIFALSSRFEGFGRVLAEAMACGLPVLSFDCPSGPGEILRGGQDGELVPIGDLKGFAAALKRLMSDPARRMDLGRRAKERSLRYEPSRICEEWEKLLRDVLRE